MTSDPKLTKVYQQAPQPEPPTALDDAIKVAAKQELETAPIKPSSRNWHVPAALAAVIMLSVIVVPLMQQEEAIYDSQEQLVDELESNHNDAAVTSGIAAPMRQKSMPTNAVRPMNAPLSEMKSLRQVAPAMRMKKRERIQADTLPRSAQESVITPHDEINEIQNLLNANQPNLARTRLEQFQKKNPDYPIPQELLKALM